METKPNFSNETISKGIESKFDIYQTSNFKDFPNIKQAYGLVINNKNELLLVAHEDLIWILPGGHIEEKETDVEALVRELYEEAAIKTNTDDCIPFFIQKAFNKINGEWIFDECQSRYIIKNYTQEIFKQDPDQENPIIFQKFVPIKNLKEYLKWGTTTELIIKEINKFLI